MNEKTQYRCEVIDALESFGLNSKDAMGLVHEHLAIVDESGRFRKDAVELAERLLREQIKIQEQRPYG